MRIQEDQKEPEFRLRIIFAFCALMCVAIIARLFYIMVIEHGLYTALAAGTQETQVKLMPERGQIYAQDLHSATVYPLAMNRDYFIVFADTRLITSDDMAHLVADKLSQAFGYSDEKKTALFDKLNSRTSAYRPIEQKVEESLVTTLKAEKLPGIGYIRKPYRFYPEGKLAAQVIGFLGKTDDGIDIGRYGIEGYWESELAGSGGFIEGSRSAQGRWISLANKSFTPATDGSNLVLTIDRTLQYYACNRLQKGLEEYGAVSGALIILDPHTGAIRAMCSLPDFDPNSYQEVKNGEAFNNTAVFTPYEPGSIFKPITMAGALNEGLLNPDTPFYDSGSRDGICQTPIKNAGNKAYQQQTMTGVLNNSINTGMVHVAELLGKDRFKKYVDAFGFGVKEGLEIDTENTGVVDSLSQNRKNQFDCYTATASFGQGLTATPLQMATAYGAIANGGILFKPYIIDEIRHADGRVEKTRPKEIHRVLTSRTASLLSGMLTSVVDYKYSKQAGVKGYYVAGKSGTAQIPGIGGYTKETNHTFMGFAPAEDPKFVLLVKYEKPQRVYAEYTAAPVFGDVTKFLLHYYGVAPTRAVSSTTH